MTGKKSNTFMIKLTSAYISSFPPNCTHAFVSSKHFPLKYLEKGANKSLPTALPECPVAPKLAPKLYILIHSPDNSNCAFE